MCVHSERIHIRSLLGSRDAASWARGTRPVAMPKYWRTWCPLGWACSKKEAQICKKDTYEAAQAFLKNHLKTSWHHKDQLSEEELEQAMLDAVIKEDTESEEEEQPMIAYPKASSQS